MYRELVSRNLRSALRASRKNTPAVIVFCLLLAGLFGVNAFGLLVRGRGIVFLFPSAELCGVLSALASAVFIAVGMGILFSGIRNSGKTACVRRWDKYLAQVREAGSEDEVFSRLDSLEPVVGVNFELRFDDAVIAGTSSEDPDRNFIYPTAALKDAGTGRIGSVPFLYLHFDNHGKVVKQTAELPLEVCEDVVQRLRSYRPDRWPDDPAISSPEEPK